MSDTDNQKHNPSKANTPKRSSRLMVAADKQADGAESQPSESRFHTVFNHSPLGNKIIDAELTIHQVNPAAVAMLGLTRLDELVGHKIIEFAHPDHVPEWQELQKELWERKTPYFILETLMVRQDGSSFWCQVTSVLFDDEAGELGYTSLQDITERKELEQTNQHLYEAQETVLQLVVHDVKNPIANIQLIVQLLEHSASGSPSTASESARLHQLIKQSCEEANTLLKEVLYLGELEANKLKKYRLDCHDFLDKQLTLHRLAAQQKGIALTLESPAKVLLASFNPDRFRRVVDNVLTNALKFTPADGQVSVRLQAHKDGVRLSVQDTGIGIPTELQAHVFNKFSAAARAGLYGESTNGLGLYITQQIVHLHGGKIWLESHENEGTTVFIDLV
ncbi:PAS domain-containing sensor histidine kinase [Hymenobacter bucti]|uniref:histidine kinase n=1 Tax=Hymenobacter bucti TaxID=1844114 RepID=A0ABW4QYB4_9BACT